MEMVLAGANVTWKDEHPQKEESKKKKKKKNYRRLPLSSCGCAC